MISPIYFDVTELVYGSGSRFQHYGIRKVVASTAMQLVRDGHDVHYCVYNFADRKFYKVLPDISGNTAVFPAPVCKQILVRTVRAKTNSFTNIATRFSQAVTRPINRKRWSKIGYPLQPLSIEGGIFVSAARAKLASEIVAHIRRARLDTKVAILLHDVIPLYNQIGTKPATKFASNFINDTRYIIEHADLVLGNSQFTIDDIQAFAGRGSLPHPKAMAAIPLVHECDETNELAEIDVPQHPYIMAVGAMLGRKNLDAVFDAMLRIKSSGQTPPLLVLAGHYRITTRKRLEDPDMAPIREFVRAIHSPNQTDLNRLYQNALAVVLASHIEGWGLPAGEALWNGTPAIVSDIPVMHEVCGNLGLYFDPNDPGALTAHITRLQNDGAFRQNLRKRIADAHGNLRDWSNVADDLMTALARLNMPHNNAISNVPTNRPIWVA